MDFIRDLKSLKTLVLRNNRISGRTPADVGEYQKLEQLEFPMESVVPKIDFGINCGGPPFISSNQLLHEEGNEALGAAIYYVTSERRWGVNNIGQRQNSNSSTVSSSSQFKNFDSELFQTARFSARSLRYYGLGLENGKLGVSRFRYKKGSRGASFSPVQRQRTIQVTDNYLAIHLFWNGKGTCCVPKQGTFGPLVSAISATPNFHPTVSNTPPSTKKNKTGLIIGILVPIAVVSFLSLLAVYIVRQWNKKQEISENYEEFLGIDAKPYTFSYGDLRDATDDFSPANKLGERFWACLQGNA